MLSRVANSIYWMGRYIERAENTARFVDVAEQMTLGRGDGVNRAASEWSPLISAIADDETFAKAYGDMTPENVARFLLLDPENPNSVLSCVSAARENARTVREVTSSEMWNEINRLYHRLRSASDLTGTSQAINLCEATKAGSLAFQGITAATLARGAGWDFLKLGTMLERADKTSRLLDVKYYLLLPSVEHVGSPLDQVQWSALLRSVSALEMYRQRFGAITPQNVVRFLVLDEYFPRSLLFCLYEAQSALDQILRDAPEIGVLPARRLGRLQSELAYGTPEDIQREGVHQFLDRFQSALNDLGGDLSKAYFNPEIRRGRGRDPDAEEEPTARGRRKADDPEAEEEAVAAPPPGHQGQRVCGPFRRRERLILSGVRSTNC